MKKAVNELNLKRQLERARKQLRQAMSGKPPKPIPMTGTLRFERFALTLLMCTPSTLWAAWTDPKATPKSVERALDDLNFSAEFKPLALSELATFFQHRLLFGALGETLHQFGSFYTLQPPHPRGADAKKIIESMQVLGAG